MAVCAAKVRSCLLEMKFDTEDREMFLFIGMLFARCLRCMGESVSDVHVLTLSVGNREIVPLQLHHHTLQTSWRSVDGLV